MDAPAGQSSLRRRVQDLLDNGGDAEARVVHGVLIALIAASLAALVLETVPQLWASYRAVFYILECAAALGFIAEYLARLWSAPEGPVFAGRSDFSARVAWMATPFALIDLATIIPLLVSLATPGGLHSMLLLRLVRFLKFARYSSGMRSLIAAIRAERRALGASAVVIIGVMLAFATAMHIAERAAQPATFDSIPKALYWAAITVTTVGYGDVVPVTIAGRMIAGVAAIMGFLLLGLPVGIIATAFAEEIHRRDFVVTWSMLARVPLFSELDASGIAEIMTNLHAQTFPSRTVVVRRGDDAHNMYFVASGEVEVETPQGPVRLGEGQFFGEVALLRETRRTATVRTRRQTKLLVLEARDLRHLMQREPKIRKQIEGVISTRGYADIAARNDMLDEGPDDS